MVLQALWGKFIIMCFVIILMMSYENHQYNLLIIIDMTGKSQVVYAMVPRPPFSKGRRQFLNQYFSPVNSLHV